MNDTQLYEQLLGLSKPWAVSQVDMDLEANRVTVRVECDRSTVWGDPETNETRAHVHGWVEREWRHLDTCQMQTYVVAKIPRLKYSSGRVEDAVVPWAERFSRITRQMEAFVIRVMEAASNVQRVGMLLRLDWHTVNQVLKRAVDRGMQRRDEQTVVFVGMDEKCMGRQHSYASVLTDISGGRVLDLVPGHALADAEKLLKTLSPKQREGVQAAAMDMWQSYMSATSVLLPKADIVHDRFHVSKMLNEAVDQVRRAEHKKLQAKGDATLKGSKFKWLHNWPDKRCAEAVQFRQEFSAHLKTSRAWAIKESFTAFWDYRRQESAARYFQEWGAKAMRSRIVPIKKVTLTLRRHKKGILNYTRHRITNAAAEGFNAVLQNINSNARGFRNFDNYRSRVLFFCGKLDLLPASA